MNTVKFKNQYETKAGLRKLLAQWKKGNLTKSEIEANYFNVTNARGKFITRLWAKRLGLVASGRFPRNRVTEV